MSIAAKNLVEKFDEEGVPTGKVATMFNGEDISFSSRDCWNHLRNLRRRNLDTGDAQAVFNFWVNHHYQSILFGCALLQDETEKSFEWLFQNWLQAMSGKSPVSIITDQDLAMKAAIAKVKLIMWTYSTVHWTCFSI